MQTLKSIFMRAITNQAKKTSQIDIGIMVRVFANGQGNLGSIPGRVIPKTQKWYLMPPCLTLSIIRYGSIQGKE